MQAPLGKRIIVIGSPGAGKSTFTKRLSRTTGIPLHHLDRIYWLPGWNPISQDEFIERQKQILSGDSWIIDGNYQGTLEMRLRQADTVVFLDFRRYLCLFRSLKRTMISTAPRTDMTEGCDEKINLDFLKWIWNYKKRNRNDTMNLLNETKAKCILRFTSPGKLEKYLEDLIRSNPQETYCREVQE